VFDELLRGKGNARPYQLTDGSSCLKVSRHLESVIRPNYQGRQPHKLRVGAAQPVGLPIDAAGYAVQFSFNP